MASRSIIVPKSKAEANTWSARHWKNHEFDNCFIIRSPSLFFKWISSGSEAICHFHARAITRRRKARFPLRMCRISFAAKHSSFSSPEPVVSWSLGREKRGSGSSRYRMSENFWHPVAHVQKLQISLLVLITEFSPLPFHWGKNFTSWALSTEWLLWDVLKMYHFTQLGFTDNLELKEEDSNRNRLNTLLICRTETINRLTIVWVIWVFFQYVWRTNNGKAISRRSI